MLPWPLGDSKYVVRHVRPSSLGPQNLAVVTAILKMRKCAISLWPLLSSTSFKNVRNYKHSWSSPFLLWRIIIDFSSKTPMIICIFGVPLFCCRRLIFTILHISMEMVKFCYVHRFFDFVYISDLLYFQWKTTHFATFTDSLFWTIFHFCYTSLLIFKILMLVDENLNISKDQWQKWASAYQPVSQPASQPASQPDSQPRQASASLGKPRQAQPSLA